MRSVKNIKALLIAVALPVLASAATHRYIVELSTEPAARFAARSFGPRKESLARPEVQTHRATIRSEQDRVIAEIQKLGGRIISRTNIASNTLSVELPSEKSGQLAAIAGVKNSHIERHYKAYLDQANLVHNFPAAYSMVGGASNAGKGIKIGMIDSGIDITQPAFSDTGFQAPAGFPKVNQVSDTQFTNNKVIVARSYVSLLDNPDPFNDATDHDGHGTSTSDCAAGGLTAISGTPSFTGAAPGAYLGNYKVFGTPTYNDSPNDTALLQAIDDAIADGMDVINYSIGYIFPIPPAQDQELTALNNAYSMGIIVTVSVGDEGNGWFPFTGNGGDSLPVQYTSADNAAVVIPTFANTEGSGNVISVGGSSNQRAFGVSLAVGNNKYLIDTEDATTQDSKGNALVYSGVPIVDVATLDQTGKACAALPANSLQGAIAFITLDGWIPSTDDCNPATKLTNVGNAGALAGVIYDNVQEDWRNFFDYSYIFGYDYFGGTNSVNVPGGFVTLSDGLAIKQQLASQANATATLDFNYSYGNVVPLSPDRVAYGSTRGPNVLYEIKPELVAVGEFLLTASETVDSNGNLYDSSGLLFPIDGTSVSAPLVAGAAAVLKSGRPGLSTGQYRSLLINSTAPVHDPNGGLARVMDAGAGLLDVRAAMNAEATVDQATLSFGVGDGSQTLTKNLTVTNAGSASDTFNISVIGRDPGFTPQVLPSSLQLGPGASGSVSVTIPGGVLTAGEYEGAIHIQGGNTSVDTHVPYWFGVPSSSPYLLVDMGSDEVDNRAQLAQGAIVFRLTDTSRIIMTNILSQVQVTFQGIDINGDGNITAGSGKVNKVYAADSYSPGTIAVDVTLDSHRNVYNVYNVQVGSLSQVFYIYGQ